MLYYPLSFSRFVYSSQKNHLLHLLLFQIPLLPLVQFTCYILLTSPLVKLSHDLPTNLYFHELKEMNQLLFHIWRSYILPCQRDMLLCFIVCSSFHIFLPVCVSEPWVTVFVLIFSSRVSESDILLVFPELHTFSYPLSSPFHYHLCTRESRENTIPAISFSIVLPFVLQVIFCSSAVCKDSPSYRLLMYL